MNSPLIGQWRGAFHVLFDLRLNKRLSKQLRRRWFETPLRPLWRHCNEFQGIKTYYMGDYLCCMDHLTHWGRVTHICVSKIIIIGSDDGLSPDRRQAIIWTNAGILLIGPWGTNFSEILIGIQTFSFKKMHMKMSSAKWRPFCLDLNVLRWQDLRWHEGSTRPIDNMWWKMTWLLLKEEWSNHNEILHIPRLLCRMALWPGLYGRSGGYQQS